MEKNLLFQQRRQTSQDRLSNIRASLANHLDKIERKFNDPEACIYATGSLARFEVTPNSDLDAFFLLSGSEAEKPLGRIRDVKILNAVVVTAEEVDFPDFSNDGEYLKFLHIEDVLRHIGGREDDYHNALTARMLMLLESQYLFNEDLYKKFKKRLVEAYFEDFHDHSKSFKPIFLLNDILRFWRTMCLNYENGRQWRVEDPEKSAKGHLANLKLKFSRLNICFSFVAHLLQKGKSSSPDDVIHTSSLCPIERMTDIATSEPELKDKIDLLLEEYAWFLDVTGDDKRKVLEWIATEKYRVEAFAHADLFVSTMSEVVGEIAQSNGYMRYLII